MTRIPAPNSSGRMLGSGGGVRRMRGDEELSAYQLLHAFADEDTLRHASVELDAHGYRTHEFGDRP
ncbi:MAG TPA: hypothetical protein VF864_03570 [Gemmatimonadales bacterium]